MTPVKKITALSFFICAFLFSGAQTNLRQLYNDGTDKFAEGKYKEAILDFSKVLEKKSETKDGYFIANTYIARAYCRAYLGNKEDAMKDVNEAVALKPEFSKAYFVKAQILKMYKLCGEGAEEVTKAIELKPGEADYFLLRGDCYFCAEQSDSAMMDYKRILEIDPANVKAYKHMATVETLRKNYSAALTYFNEAVKIDPKDGELYLNRGLCKGEMKDFKGAEEDILYGKEVNPDLAYTAYNNIAFFVKFAQEDYKGAIEYFDKAIELNPKFAFSYNNKGFALYKMNDFKAAVREIKKSLELDAKNSYAWKNLGIVYLAQGKKEDACLQFKKAIELGYSEQYDDEVSKLLENNCKK